MRIVFLILLCSTITAVADDLVLRLHNGQARQQGLQTRSRQVEQQIAAIIDEYDRNGMGQGPEIQTLRAVRAVLSSLSAQEMNKVVELLGQAANTPALTPDATRRLVGGAYVRQKSILIQLEQLLL